MKFAANKYYLFWCLLFLAVGFLVGCASGPKQQNTAWPWQYGKDYGNHQTGDYMAISGPIATFGEAPPAAKPISQETLEKHVSDSQTQSGTAITKSQPPLPPADSSPIRDKAAPRGKGKYDFTVHEVKIAPPSYLPQESVQTVFDITAFNHGNAPVTVSFGVDPNATQNLSADKNLPLNAVIPANTEQTLVRFAPKLKNESFNFRYSYSWSIGDYRATHHCPERYEYPFGKNIKGYAIVNTKENTALYNRHAVIFTIPAGTPVLAARKGTVIQIKADNKIDILHDDSTIATYSHLGKIDEGLFVGKAVSAEDTLGTADADANIREAHIQLTVWRPEPLAVASLKTQSPSSDFDLVSFPLEFCSTDNRICRVLSQNQPVSRNGAPVTKKQEKSKSKPAKR